MTYQRYAVYYAPKANTPLAKFGTSWLGWDAEKNCEVARPDLDGLSSAEIAALTQSPSRYGFHGTLKPPFFLNDGCTCDDLDIALQGLSQTLGPLTLAPLKLVRLGKFFALVPSEVTPDLRDLASACVRELDHFRKPPSDQELARRRQKNLSPRQELLLDQWGYPYVMDEFCFHLTLTSALDPAQADKVHPLLTKLVEPLITQPFEISDLCLFGDPGENKPFQLLTRYTL